MTVCKNCGTVLSDRRKLTSFCNYAGRGQHRVARLTKGRTGLRRSRNLKQNRPLRTLKSGSVAGFAFVAINSTSQRSDSRNVGGRALFRLLTNARPQKPAYMPRHRAISVAEIGFSAVLAEGLVRAFIGATDGGLSLRRIEICRQIGARISIRLAPRSRSTADMSLRAPEGPDRQQSDALQGIGRRDP